MQGNAIKKGFTSFVGGKIPHISRHCKLVSVQYGEYENDLLRTLLMCALYAIEPW